MIAWLGGRDEEELRSLLLEDPVQNLFLLGILEERGVEGRPSGPPIGFVGIRRGGRLAGAVFVGGRGRLLVPSCADPADAGAAGEYLAGRLTVGHLVGERGATDALWTGLGAPRVRLRREHRLMVLTPGACGPHVAPALRRAATADLDAVVELGRQLHREELDVDPMTTDPEGFRRRNADRIGVGRTWVLEVDGAIAFRAEVGTLGRHGAQVEGVITAPAFRRRGLATRALGQLGRTLLAGLPRVTLHAAESNAAALAVYRRVGFVPANAFRLIVAE